ncbi:MAG: hypothetical protein FJZ47_24710 [Candidatus Tectomicrobia bacterium]|uniref:Uncharacterized protein n=1 Tax=Tectimicrobiota bacterium TaxID=2528274 RepID=A0A938B4Y9_UNCTE|nr:hypothetical protein [Candidatus Tectomicrobia bacterium]
MSGFARHETHGICLWMGDPDCQAAHDGILQWLQEKCPTFCTDLPVGGSLNILRGNLGETIAFYTGYWSVFQSVDVKSFTANALNPFGRISKPDIDIVWIHFGATTDDDLAFLQEVKTTGEVSLSLADSLISDYEKLFATNVQGIMYPENWTTE